MDNPLRPEPSTDQEDDSAAVLGSLLRRQLDAGERLQREALDAQRFAEWKLDTEPLIAGVEGSAEALAAFLELGRGAAEPSEALGRGLELLRQVIAIAEGPRIEAEPSPAPPPAQAPRPAFTLPAAPTVATLDDALLLAELADAPPSAREEAASHLRAIHQELAQEHPSWEVLRPLAASLVGFDKEVFLTIAAWLADRAEAIE